MSMVVVCCSAGSTARRTGGVQDMTSACAIYAAAASGWVRVSSSPRVCRHYADLQLQRMPGGYALGLLSVSVCTAAACCHGICQSTCLAGRNKFESDGQGAILPIVWNTLSAALVHNRQLTNEQCFEVR
jgi:hypothetical protein